VLSGKENLANMKIITRIIIVLIILFVSQVIISCRPIYEYSMTIEVTNMSDKELDVSVRLITVGIPITFETGAIRSIGIVLPGETVKKSLMAPDYSIGYIVVEARDKDDNLVFTHDFITKDFLEAKSKVTIPPAL
jgi:hypothetical protein